MKSGRADGPFPTANRCADTEKKWYVFYLRPRAEKVVCQDLTKRGYEVFLPTSWSIRVWRNRQRKKIQLPLFPNYIFVRTYVYELYNIKCVPKVVTYITLEGKPATITDSEVEGIRQMLNAEKEISVETKFYRGERVKVISGPLSGYEGILVRQNGKSRFGIQLKAISHAAFIDISITALEKLK